LLENCIQIWCFAIRPSIYGVRYVSQDNISPLVSVKNCRAKATKSTDTNTPTALDVSQTVKNHKSHHTVTQATG